MDKMTRKDAAEILVNNGVTESISALYADAYVEWKEAIENIEKNGSIVSNPRSGVPMENPYLKVRDKAFERLRTLKNIDSSGLW